MPDVVCLECGDPVPPSPYGRPRKYCDRKCRERHNHRAWREANRPLKRARENRYRARLRGYLCKWCRRSGPPMQSQEECCACYRVRRRSPCRTCGGPFYQSPAWGHAIGCEMCTSA